MPEDIDLDELEEACEDFLEEAPGKGYESAERFKAFDDALDEEDPADDYEKLYSLLRRYRDVALHDVFPLEECSNAEGSCSVVEKRVPVDVPIFSRQHAYRKLSSDLTLCYGVGPATAHRFAAREVRTLHALQRTGSHFADPGYISLLERGDCHGMYQYIQSQKKRYCDPLIFALHNYMNPEQMAFIDIESMGLGGQPLFLIGVGRIRDGELVIRQYLARSFEQEPALLRQFLDEQQDAAAIVSFNGKKFDTPFINSRLSYYGMPSQEDTLEFDVYLFARHCFAGRMPRHRLLDYEASLYGRVRDDDVAGNLVPHFYEEACFSRNIGPLVPIIHHNQEDIITTYKLFCTLKERWDV